MSYELCRHIRTRGTRCQSPALHGGSWCFFHADLHKRHQCFRHTEATRGYLIPGQHIELAPLEDRESVQMALSVVVNALATGNLDVKRATAILYGLQLASMNATRLTPPPASDIIQQAEETPEGLHLAEPESVELIPFDADEEEEEEEESDHDYD